MLFLKFPPLLAGGYSLATWLLLIAIVALVAGVLWFVFTRLDDTVE